MEVKRHSRAVMFMLPYLMVAVSAILYGAGALFVGFNNGIISSYLTTTSIILSPLGVLKIAVICYLILFILHIAAFLMLPPVIKFDTTENNSDRCPNESNDFKKT